VIKNKFRISISEGNITPDFVVVKNDKVLMECREMISKSTVGSKNAVIFRVVFAPGAEHSKHRHMNCDEMVYCLSGRGAEGIEVEDRKYEEYEYVPGVIIYVPKGTAHYTRNLDIFEPLVLIGFFPGVSSMDKKDTGYEPLGEITSSERVLR
jgi:quercetin dioxygenase-like cupin family protein